MRRWLHLAGLLQYLLMLLLAGLLVLLVMAGASPRIFALALMLGAFLAALPVIYVGAILLPRQSRELQRVRRDGLPACAEVLADGEQLTTDTARGAGVFKGLPLPVEIPVRVLPAASDLSYPAQLSASAQQFALFKPGDWLAVRSDPHNPAQVVPAGDPQEPLTIWTVRPVLGADSSQLAGVIRDAFEEQRGLLDPPAGAFSETAASLQARLENSSGLLAEIRGSPVACIFYRPESGPESAPVPGSEPGAGHGHVFLSRLAVLPEFRRLGIGRCLLAQAEQLATQNGYNLVRLGVRAESSANREYYQRLGYRVIEEHSHEGYTKITVYILEKEI
jgi:ribosomal protein S18 acetylase RimI-like enzyme